MSQKKCTPQLIAEIVKELSKNNRHLVIMPKVIAYEIVCSPETVRKNLRKDPELARKLGIITKPIAKQRLLEAKTKELKEHTRTLRKGERMVLAKVCKKLRISLHVLYNIFAMEPQLHQRIVGPRARRSRQRCLK